jgi:ribonuclease R
MTASTSPGSTPDTKPPADVVAEALQALEIDVRHSAASIAETDHWLANSGIDDPTLLDLTRLPFVTIDNPDSRDLDQALLIERHDAECYRVCYALADAAYYVRAGSALFEEALARGATYYTPLLAAPMLPPALSEGLISLNPQVDRRALVFDMLIDRSAVVTRTSIARARIHSRAKLSYAGVQAWLDGAEPPARDFDESLLLLRELGGLLIEAAARRGVVRFDRSETRITVQGEPAHFQASRRSRYQTERFNEQISLMCNMQGAEMLLALAGISDALQAVYRVHEAPLQKSLGELRRTLDAFANAQDQPERWRWSAGQSLADYVESLPDDRQYARHVQAVQRQIMQAQRAASFTPVAGEHHALKAASYARFSSPMREIVGIFTHKELLEALSGNAYENDADADLREAVIAAANQARQRQRQLDKRIEFAALSSVFDRELSMAQPPVHTGTIMGFTGDRIYISLDDMAVDVKVYREDLEAQFATGYSLTQIEASPDDDSRPVWQLGQGVALCVSGYDGTRRRFMFNLAGITGPAIMSCASRTGHIT